MPPEALKKDAPASAPEILSTPQSCHGPREKSSRLAQAFALENLAQPARQDRKARNFARVIKRAFQALRRFEPLPEAVRRLANLILENSYACERTFAYVKQQKGFGVVLDLDKSEITRAFNWMEEKRIIIRAGGYYAFHAGLFLRVNERQSPAQTEMELSLEHPDCQPFFPREVNLNDQQVEAILVEPGSTESGVVVDPASTRVEPDSTISGQDKPGASSIRPRPASGKHAPVETGSTPLKALSHYKPLSFKLGGEPMELETALADVGSRHEPQAMQGMLRILGVEVMEPSERNPLGDGGKWRTRWRTMPNKTHRVMAAIVAQMKDPSADPIKALGGYAEDLWKRFA